MHNLVLSPRLLGFVVGTRIMLGLGVGLLVAGRLPDDRRRTIGLTLVAIGAATTVPAVISLRRSRTRIRKSLRGHSSTDPGSPSAPIEQIRPTD